MDKVSSMGPRLATGLSAALARELSTPTEPSQPRALSRAQKALPHQEPGWFLATLRGKTSSTYYLQGAEQG